MIININKISKRAKNSIKIQIQKLIDKYGHQQTRIVVNHYFANIKTEEKKRKEIARLENELKQLKRNK